MAYIDERTQKFLDNIISGASNEELFKAEKPQPIQRDPMSEAIVSFAPGILGALTGESGALAAPAASKQVRDFYESNIKNQQAVADKAAEMANKQREKDLELNLKVDKEIQDRGAKAQDRELRVQQLAQQAILNRENQELRKLQIQAMSDAARERLSAAAESRAAKQEEKDLVLAVPGFERTGEVLPKVEESAKLRKATVSAEQLQQKLGRLRDIVSEKGSFEYGGEAGQEMASLATEIQLLSKGPEMYELGVLAGPDLTLLQKITADPESISSLFTRDKTRLKQIDSQIKSVQEKLKSTAKSMGYIQKVAPPEKTVVKKFVNQKTGQTKLVYSDGTEEIK